MRILQLVVVDRMRQRHQHRRPAHHRQLGDSGGAGPADHQVRLCHFLGQVGEERRQVRAHAGRLIGLLDALQVLLAALLHDEQAGADRLRQQRKRRRQCIGEEARALAAAEHQQREGPVRACGG